MMSRREKPYLRPRFTNFHFGQLFHPERSLRKIWSNSESENNLICASDEHKRTPTKMPAIKKRMKNSSQPDGAKRKFLLDNYLCLPAAENFLNGHVLQLYHVLCGQSRTSTVKKLVSHCSVDNLSVDQRSELLRHLTNSVKRLTDKTKSFMKLTDSTELGRYCSICCERFSMVPDGLGARPSTSMPACNDDVCQSEVMPMVAEAVVLPSTSMMVTDDCADKSESVAKPVPTTPLKTRQISKCSSCKILRKSAQDLRKKQLQMQRDNMVTIKSLRAKYCKKDAIKRLNQKIRRKEIQLKKTKEKFEMTPAAKDLDLAKKSISSLEKKHKRLKKYHKLKKALPFSTEPSMEITEFKDKLAEKDGEINFLQNKVLVLEEQVEGLQQTIQESKADGRQYSPDMRMQVYDLIVNQVPTQNIPIILKQFALRNTITLKEIPHRTTVEAMVRELGAVSELQTAELLISNENCTMGFDATTQEGVHVNSIHFTTISDCLVAAMDELPGGTAEDYCNHVCDTVDNLASVYSYFNDVEENDAKAKIVHNISNTMTDRCAANHAAIELICQSWDKILNELNCHLHPLDSIATKTRGALKDFEKDAGIRKKIFGTDCIVGGIVLQMNKMRYKDGKGDPRGFCIFLDKNKLPRGILPRYRGNRLHILFHTCGVLIQHYALFVEFLEKGTGCGGLRKSILEDFKSKEGHVEMQVLGLLGKFLTGPWMRLFYTSAADQIDYIDGIARVKDVLKELRAVKDRPEDLLSRATDIFGGNLDAADAILEKLREPPVDATLFKDAMERCLSAIIEVLERQYKKYFNRDLPRTETKSVRSHNMDAEQMIGMFSATQKRAPNATLCYLSSKMRAQKNKTIQYLDAMTKERRELVLRKVVAFAQKQRKRRRSRQKDLMLELQKRHADKLQAKETTDKKKVEAKLKTMIGDVSKLAEEYPDMEELELEKLTDLITGKAVGQYICQVWYEEGEHVRYHGKIEKVRGSGKKKEYVVGYWNEDETYDNAVDFDMSVFALGTDLILQDLTM